MVSIVGNYVQLNQNMYTANTSHDYLLKAVTAANIPVYKNIQIR